VTGEDARSLYAYNRWANSRVFGACRPVDASTLSRNLGNSFGSIRDTLAHIVWAEWLWLERWQHRSPKQAELPDTSSLAAIEKTLLEVERGQQQFLDALPDDRLGERIAYVNIKGERWEYTLARMLQHVVNHSTYHRGQVITMLKQTGAAAVSSDYLLYFDEMAT
jgi:uncharacterized damage-inducible protein DinB